MCEYYSKYVLNYDCLRNASDRNLKLGVADIYEIMLPKSSLK